MYTLNFFNISIFNGCRKLDLNKIFKFDSGDDYSGDSKSVFNKISSALNSRESIALFYAKR